MSQNDLRVSNDIKHVRNNTSDGAVVGENDTRDVDQSAWSGLCYSAYHSNLPTITI